VPRQSRSEAPGALRYVRGWGIDRTKVFQNDIDWHDFVSRLAERCRDGNVVVYAWVLMSNQVHLLMRTGQRPLCQRMRKLLTGYGVNLNRRHQRYGHRFQNRYESIICEEGPYLLELTRDIHYEEFVREGTSQGSRPELVRGGLMRSLGGWAQGLFIDQPAVIEKILTHLGLWPARAHGPPEAAAA
jgi:REP element-mobilizing transposase RayT